MKYQIVFCFFITFSIGVFGKDTRILGGQRAEITQYPYLVTIRYIEENVLFCGGMIISERHILTAAHCLYVHQEYYNLLRVYTVLTNPQSVNEPAYKISKVTYHPEYNEAMSPDNMNINDVAVIKIKETLQFNQYQNKIELPTSKIDANVLCAMSGWGTVQYPEDVLPEFLQETDMQTVERGLCAIVLPFKLHDGQLCAYKRKGIGSCNGDSGGPLVHDGKIIGIISFSLPCAQGLPDIFSDVFYYKDFITSAMRD